MAVSTRRLTTRWKIGTPERWAELPLSDSEKLVLRYLFDQQGPDGWTTAGLEQIAEGVGRSRQLVVKLLHRLDGRGMLARQRHVGGRHNMTRYRVLDTGSDEPLPIPGTRIEYV